MFIQKPDWDEVIPAELKIVGKALISADLCETQVSPSRSYFSPDVEPLTSVML